ncbi:hypothetical protein PoB_000333600 [Plakobranchus ocellatus]|uniref:Uncharacterized protein n=1 Tax=Plakobranchus ocellatus TaxID=259542 RepID=A0AAV3Y160_9GAST|nr:hypothetical protein PoB_000333600 [Plakobranchus ocellatus]
MEQDYEIKAKSQSSKEKEQDKSEIYHTIVFRLSSNGLLFSYSMPVSSHSTSPKTHLPNSDSQTQAGSTGTDSEAATRPGTGQEMTDLPGLTHTVSLGTKTTVTRSTTNGTISQGPFTQAPVGTFGAGIARFSQEQHSIRAIHFDPEQHRITYNCPGIYPDLDRHGHPKLHSLVFQLVPALLYHMKNPAVKGDHTFWMLDIKEIIAAKTCSMIALNFYMEILPAMYDTSKSIGDMSVDLQMFRGGTKFFYITQDYWTPDRCHPVTRCITKPAIFDTVARAALALPKHVVTSLPDIQADLVPEIWREQLPQPPSHAYRYSARVVWSYVDCNGHMGFQWYPQHALDAIVEAITSPETEAIKSLTTFNLVAGVKSLNVLYIKECGFEDDLELLAWEDEAKANTAHCWMQKQGETISKCTFTFYNAASPTELSTDKRRKDGKSSL